MEGMSDRYLCKAKSADNGEWIYGSRLKTDDGTFVIQNYAPLEGIGKYMVDPSTLCQCTGLPDKKMRKIWENDIVIYLDENTGEYKTDIIKWNKTYAAFCRLHRSEMGLQYLLIDECIANKCEVIGNVFDNPELLEGSAE